MASCIKVVLTVLRRILRHIIKEESSETMSFRNCIVASSWPDTAHWYLKLVTAVTVSENRTVQEADGFSHPLCQRIPK